MSNTNHSPTMTIMVRALEKASRSLLRDFGEVENLQVSQKGPGDFVSQADLRSEKILVTELEKARPDFGFLLEEGGVKDGADKTHRWIIDPLDGTANFLHSIPQWCISLALEKTSGDQKEIIAAAIYDPLRLELFWAEKGRGAFMNNRRLRVSARRDMGIAMLCTGIPANGRKSRHSHFLAQQSALMPHVSGIRRMGAAALDLAYVAAGRFEGFWEDGLSPWDIAAAALILQEAGGRLSGLDGRTDTTDIIYKGDVLATNGHLHEPILGLLKSAESKAA